RISKRDPMDYVARYAISEEKLAQQYIKPNFVTTDLADLEKWVRDRAQALADAGNVYLTKLRGNLQLPQLLPTEQASAHAFDNDGTDGPAAEPERHRAPAPSGSPHQQPDGRDGAELRAE